MVDAFFGSQSFIVMVRQKLFGKQVSPLSPVVASAAVADVGGWRWFSPVISTPMDPFSIFLRMGCYLLLCWNNCTLSSLPRCSICAIMWLIE